MDKVQRAEIELDAKRSGCVLLRELPSRPTQRACNLSAQLQQASSALDLEAFTGPCDQQQQQLKAFQDTWQNITCTIKDVRQHNLAPIVNQLQQWVATNGPLQPEQQHATTGDSSALNGELVPPSAVAASLPCGCHQLPMVSLSVATSTNTAATYAEILYTLKSKGHPVALVPARDVASGPSAVINTTMRSYLKEATAADDVPALLAWWKDIHQQHHGTTGGQIAPAAAQAVDKGGLASTSTAAATPKGKGAQPAAATPARELRSRTPAKTPGKATAGGAGGSNDAKELGPPVIVLQEADSVDMEALEELVVALSEARVSGLPVVVVLGVSITPAYLLQMLSNAVLRRAQLLTLALPPARNQVADLYRLLLLRAPQPPLVLGPTVLSWLMQHFKDVDCSAAMTERVLQLACVQHFTQQQQLSCLAPAAATGSRKVLAAAVKQLSQDQLLLCCKALLSHPAAAAAGDAKDSSANKSLVSRSNQQTAAVAMKQLQAFVGKGSSSSSSGVHVMKAAASVLEESIWGSMQAYGRWRLGVVLLDLLARFTGAADVDASLQLPAIYSAAMQPDFLTVKKRGNLSACGRLLLKVLGNSGGSSGGSSGMSRQGVTAVRALLDNEIMQLLDKVVEVVGDAQLSGKQRSKQEKQRAADDDTSSGNSSGDSSSDDSSDDGDADTPCSQQESPLVGDALAGCKEVQQLQQALIALQAAAASAAGENSEAPTARLSSPNKRQKCQPDDQGLADQDRIRLDDLADQIKELLTPLDDILEQAAAAAGGGSLVNTPAAKTGAAAAAAAAAGSSQGAFTPGGLASLLKRQVRFAPDTPNHANGKHVGSSSSARSTPESQAGEPTPGLIKTPKKKGSSSTQPKRLFAAAANAAAAAAKQPKRKKGEKKQAAEMGEIAGSSAAALAAAAGLAQSPAAAAAAAATPLAGNKRTQRLMQMMAASAPSAAASKGPGDSSSGPAGAPAGIRSSKGLSITPITIDSSAVAAASGSSPEATLLSPRASRAGRGSSRAAASGSSPERMLLSPKAAAAAIRGSRWAAAAAPFAASPAVGRAAGAANRGGSRLSRQSEPTLQHQQTPDETATGNIEDSDAEEHAFVAAAAAKEMQERDQQQQQHESDKQSVPTAVTAVSLFASLLEAVIPKLLLDWSLMKSSINSSSNILTAAAAAAFTFDDVESIHSMLSPAPGCAVHAALVNPSSKLPGHPQQLQQDWEDTCLAYVLLQQQRDDSLAVSDWFGLFCQAQGLKGFRGSQAGLVGYNDGSDMDADDDDVGGKGSKAGGGRATRAKARAGRKARGYAEARSSAAAAADASIKAGSGLRTATKDQAATPKSASKKRGAAAAGNGEVQDDGAAAAVDEQELLSAAARFCQAAAELQLLGIWKAAKRRRLAAVHRVFAPEGKLMLGGGSSSHVESLPDHEY